MTGAEGARGSCRDEPRHVVIVLDRPLTHDESVRLGKVLGANGFAGRFVGGSLAELAGLGARARREAGLSDG